MCCEAQSIETRPFYEFDLSIEGNNTRKSWITLKQSLDWFFRQEQMVNSECSECGGKQEA